MAWIPKQKMVSCPNPECSGIGRQPHIDFYRSGSRYYAGWCPVCKLMGPRTLFEKEAVRLWNLVFKKTANGHSD